MRALVAFTLFARPRAARGRVRALLSLIAAVALVGSVSVIAAPGARAATDYLDAYNDNTTPCTRAPYCYPFALNDFRQVAQTFTAGKTGTLDKLELYMYAPYGAPGTLTVALEGVSSGVPDGVVAATTSLSVADMPSSGFGWVTATFPAPAPITAGAQYAIVLSDLAAPANTDYLWASSASPYYPGGMDSYPNGAGLISEYGSAWGTFIEGPIDFLFRTYVVPPLTFTGFDQPVDNTVLNTAKAGQTITLKWRLTYADGSPVTDLASVTVTATSLSCDLGISTDQIEEYATGSSGLQNLGDGYYQYNWATPKSYANSCKTLHLDLGDGVDHTAQFQFTK